VIQKSARSWRIAHASSRETLTSTEAPVLCVIRKPSSSKVNVIVLITSLFMPQSVQQNIQTRDEYFLSGSGFQSTSLF
jgi:hypothetical protein